MHALREKTRRSRSKETTPVIPRLRKPKEVPGNTPALLSCFSTLRFRYGFGEAGKPKFGIEPNAELIYEVTLKSFEKVRQWNISKILVGFLSILSVTVR